MEIREKTCKSGRTWKFVNETWENSNAWGHKTTIIRSGYDFDAVKVRYYNRTWESYAYQTCMLKAVRTIYDNELNRFIENYKYVNDVLRFKKGEKDKVVKMFEEEEIARDLNELIEAITTKNFN